MEPSPQKPKTALRQLGLALDSVKLQGMCPSERTEAVLVLAELLMQAAGVVVEENGDELG
jgi:hypothetical protein